MPATTAINTQPEYDPQNRQLLLVYAIYRQALTLVVWVLYLADSGVGNDQPLLFVTSASLYLLINSGLLYKATTPWNPSFFTILSIIASDIIGIQLIALASGGIGSGLSVLMIVSVAAGSLFLQTNKAFLVPAFATITLLVSVAASVVRDTAHHAEIATSGWLGILFFIASTLISYLSSRVEKSDLRALQEFEHARGLEQLNSLIIDRMQTGILVVNIDGNIVSFNRAATELLQFNEKQKKYRYLKEIDSRLQAFLESIISSINHNISAAEKDDNNGQRPSPYSLHLQYDNRNLKLVWINLNESNLSEFLIFIEDLSKISQQAQQLKLSSLGKLTASIAHEIRNPLGAVSHAAQLLEGLDNNEENNRLKEIIINQTRRCSDVIESILSVSRGGASDIQQFNLNGWLPKFLDDYKIGNPCQITVIGEHSLNVRFDQSQLTQILTNLLDNAIRYSEESSNDRFALLFSSKNELGRPRLDVVDKGTGVLPKDAERLFEPFFTRSKQGSGLGLYLSRELCEANQASIYYVADPYDGVNSSLIEQLNSAGEFKHCFRIQFAHPDRSAIFQDSAYPSQSRAQASN